MPSTWPLKVRAVNSEKNVLNIALTVWAVANISRSLSISLRNSLISVTFES